MEKIFQAVKKAIRLHPNMIINTKLVKELHDFGFEWVEVDDIELVTIAEGETPIQEVVRVRIEEKVGDRLNYFTLDVSKSLDPYADGIGLRISKGSNKSVSLLEIRKCIVR